MEDEIKEILFKLDSNNGRRTKIRMMRILKDGKKNSNEIAGYLGLKSISHMRKFLKNLHENFLVDYEEKVYHNEYHLKYSKKYWFLTDLGIEVLNYLKNVSFDSKLTPKMFLEKLKKDIRNTEEYENWRRKVIERDGFICKYCGIEGPVQAHHIKLFSDILKENNINSVEEAKNCEELWDVDNGEVICSRCHIDKHTKGKAENE